MKKLILLLILILNFGLAIAQNLSPLELVEKVLTDKKFVKNKTNYASGEFLNWNKAKPTVKEFKKSIHKKFTLLSQNDSSAVVNVTITNDSNAGFDCYYFLKKNNDWKITEYRALAQTGIIEMALKEMENMSESERDTLISKSKRYNSIDDLNLEIENMKLTLALDDTIINFFKTHETEFNALLSEVLNNSTENKHSRLYKLTENQENRYKNLLLSSVSKSYICDKGIEFLIGGILDNSVGYLYIPEGEEVPNINPDNLIMLRKITDNWYIFKTT